MLDQDAGHGCRSSLAEMSLISRNRLVWGWCECYSCESDGSQVTRMHACKDGGWCEIECGVEEKLDQSGQLGTRASDAKRPSDVKLPAVSTTPQRYLRAWRCSMHIRRQSERGCLAIFHDIDNRIEGGAIGMHEEWHPYDSIRKHPSSPDCSPCMSNID